MNDNNNDLWRPGPTRPERACAAPQPETDEERYKRQVRELPEVQHPFDPYVKGA